MTPSLPRAPQIGSRQVVAVPGKFAERVIAACRAYMSTYDVLAVEVREHMQVKMADALRASDAMLAASPLPSSSGTGGQASKGAQEVAMRKLTEAQRRCLSDVADNIVLREFDVWGGYRWHRGEFVTNWRKSEHAMPKPLDRLCELGFVEIGLTERPYSGRHLSHYTLTPAGRAKLAEERG